MTLQELGPFSFESPKDWQNRAILVFVAAAEDPSISPNIIVVREDRAPGEELATYVWRSVFDGGKTLPDFELLGSREMTIDGQPAIKVLVRWSSDKGKVEQALVWIDGAEGSALRVTCTAIDRREAFDELENLLSTVRFASLRIGGRASMVPSSAVPLGPPPSTIPPPESAETYGSVPMPGAWPMRRPAR
jgi:hypothetical protein